MSRAAVLAFLAGACAVPAAWEAALALERARPAAWLARALAPLAAAGVTGRAPDAGERRRLAVVGAAALLGAGWLLLGPLPALAVAGAGPAAAGQVVRLRRRRFRRELAAGAPAVARALADALAGGHSVRGALLETGRRGGLGGASGAVLGQAAHALSLGERTDTVVAALARRARDPGWDTLAAAVLLQREAGGDLAGLLRSLAAQLESAARTAQDARTATAQARFTALVVTLMPLGGLVLVELASPGFVAGLIATPLTALAVGSALFLQLLALVLVRRLGRVPA